MTEVTPDPRESFARAASVFAELRHLSALEREQRLDALALQSPELAEEVRSLLSHAGGEPQMLDRPVVMSPEGMMVGRFRILSTIGEGGMGTVFLAEQQEPVRRHVALKLIKLGMDTRAIVRRFQAERQVLAQMEHPGIARILDGGVAPDGRPYFVMELVRGQPLTDWCQAQNLDTQARIRLFLEVCSAVQHAHQKGVIHRDLKPSNLLVTYGDGRPVPKVIDFGIAKSLTDDSQGATHVSGGVGRAGTPEYMSPEQSGLIESNGFDIRSDVYSLGIVLYELLTGTTPSRARTRSGATRRPASIQPRLRGDLDAIILKAVEREPARRYATVAAFAEDLQRHLANEPVVARPASALYVSAQFARRHTLVLGAAFTVLMALCVGLALALWGMQRARQELFASTVEQGRLAGVVGDLVVARDILWKCYQEQPDSPHAAWALRELYFRHPSLWTLQQSGLRSSQVEVVDPETLVVACGGRAPFALNLQTRAELFACSPAAPDGRSHHPHRMDVSPDRALVAVGDNDGDVRVWSLRDRAFLGTVASHGSGTASAVFLDGGGTLLTAGADGRLLRVAHTHPNEAQVIWQAPAHVRALASHVATGHVAAGLADGTVLLWRALDQPPQRLNAHRDWVLCLEFDATGQWLASGSRDRSAKVWNTQDGTEHLRLPSNNGTVRDLAYAPDGTLFILGWWHLDQLRPGRTEVEQVVSEGGWRVAVPSNGEVVVSNAQEPALRRWRLDSESLLSRVTASAGCTLRQVGGGSAPLLFARGRNLEARNLGGEVEWTHEFGAGISSVGAAIEGTRVAVGLTDGTLWSRAVPAAAWECLARDFAPGSADVVAVDRSGTHVAYPTAGNAVVVVHVDQLTGTSRRVLAESPNGAIAIQFSRDQRTLAVAERRTGLRVADLRSGEQRFHPCEQTSFSLDTTADGEILLGSWTGPILVAHPERGALETRSLRGHTAVVGALCVHPTDANLLLSGSMDGTVRLWHLGLQREVQSISPFGGAPVSRVAFDATGAHVVATSSEGRAVTWALYAADSMIRDNYPKLPEEAQDQPRQQFHLD